MRFSRIFKKRLVTIPLAVVFLAAVSVIAVRTQQKPKPKAVESEYVYVCPMGYPEWSDKPAKSKLCGMDMIKKKRSEVPWLTGKGGVIMVTVSPAEQVLANVQTAEAQMRKLQEEILAFGKVDYAEPGLAQITARIPGRVDRLYVDYTGARVEPGNPLLEIYSPELVSTQEEYLLSLNAIQELSPLGNPGAVSSARSLAGAARKRLLLWGITEKQIEKLETSRSSSTYLTVYVPVRGTVVMKNVVQGQYVNEGDILYQIADLSKVWVHVNVYESEISFLKLGEEVQITVEAYPGETFHGKTVFIDPVLDPATRTVRVRAEFDNRSGKLKPEMFVNARIVSPTDGDVLAIPVTAVLSTGKRSVAWVQTDSTLFEPRAVKLGPRAGDYYEVFDGLEEGERVVTRAGFLLDSEAQLKFGVYAGKDSGQAAEPMKENGK